jgi:hypothetical protein
MREILSLKLLWVRSPSAEKEKANLSISLLKVLGGAEGDRTPDPKTASLVLSQLSYSPTFFPANARGNVTSRSGLVKRKSRDRPVDVGLPVRYLGP